MRLPADRHFTQYAIKVIFTETTTLQKNSPPPDDQPKVATFPCIVIACMLWPIERNTVNPMENKSECKVVLYGISPKNCDTIKKARKWLDEAGVDYRFHDHRADGLDPAALDGWLAKLGWEALLNTRGTTFRALPEEEKQGLDNDKARALLLAHPAMIKRPLLDRDGELTLGFKADHYQSLFSR